MKRFIILIAILLFTNICFAGELTKELSVGKIEVLENGIVQYRILAKAYEDGKLIGQSIVDAQIVDPGEDYSKLDAKVKAVCEKVHTQAVIDAYTNPIKPQPTPGLSKETAVDKIVILEDGRVIARQVVRVVDDGMVIGSSEGFATIKPGDDYSAHEKRIKDICTVIQTKDVVDAYKAKNSVAAKPGGNPK